ncbi:thiamine-phosphate diphosphorylase [Halanaerobium congolense]|jgi:thiamine-phosphate pyrophosphorylase|uniref:Thiamine-phosphate synthase n=1 Tax=Halanaerobium congolense TaxID=54121 RepID=A0A1G8I7L7_9FIRM|nr:thiamine phosphate synthase [Halanaerobium congolense]OEG62793.1 MAG: thiamine-phosphate diphosphorylase [Halanaerobium sp. MDAL1]PUU88336.1 MAG: thiamine-phosphate pyrophosphorylase [Halanaerobium sp.]TDP11601.1 thiamine-phosphate diphosphorylase [Halanaerobium congolense]TDX42406.1 thiamine-phosphate diphosphorylase [Halanaerobium congolense]SDI14975.1 thiamine-phosphate diphosphorylase [Halanaerobium congolense]
MLNWDLYLITEESLSAGRKTIEVVKEAAAAGVDVIQLREKNLSLREKFKLGQQIKKICSRYQITLIVNDRLDLALALDADGVHLGQSDLPLRSARKILGPNKIIGLSACRDQEITQAEADGADYLGVGAIFKTKSKQLNSDKNGIGLQRLAEIKKRTDLPLIAIGGLNKSNAPQVIKSGADCISVITALTKAEKIENETREFKQIIKKAKSKRRVQNCQQKLVKIEKNMPKG